jgi:hypothetical protein
MARWISLAILSDTHEVQGGVDSGNDVQKHPVANLLRTVLQRTRPCRVANR